LDRAAESAYDKNERVPYLSFRPPEQGQPFWSSLLLSCCIAGVEVSKPKVQVSVKATSPKQAEALKKDSASTFSDDEIRVRAYQIYESRDRNGNHADEDWSQAQTELMELLNVK
jgi:hypothetical protein